MVCSACGSEAPPGARFCAECGRPFRTVEDERRVVTVLFADIVGFTTLSERLDPELVKNLVDRCFNEMARVVGDFGGQVDKVVGDAMVALFGAPVAHEDDADRAVRAALRMHEVLESEALVIGHELRLRIGVNTGEVLVGAMRAAGAITAMGDVVNTASRLQATGSPGDVLVGPATYSATASTIAYEPLGFVAAKGREEAVETWRAVAALMPPGHRVRRVGGELVGRDHEVGLLRNTVASTVVHSRASLVLLLGDVGLGKSRIADEVAEWAVEEHAAVVRRGRCVPYGEANVWWPVADALRGSLEVEDGDSAAAALEKIKAEVANVLNDPDEALVEVTSEGLATLLGYDLAPNSDAAAMRSLAAKALGTYTAASAARRPLVLQISDLHFADDVVLQLIDDVLGLEQVHHRSIVMFVTARPNLLERWTPRVGRHNSLVLHLDPLTRSATGELLEVLTGSPVADEVVEAFYDRSGGNPFFVEELLALLGGPDDAVGSDESLTRAAAFPDELPDTLRGLVAARLDDLTPAVRAVLQDAAVLGTRGSLEALGRMARELGRSIDVNDAVGHLVHDEIMHLDEDRWSFRSDLVREVAYQTITKTDRAVRHGGIAVYLEQTVASLDPRPVWVVDQLAHHYAEAAMLAREIGPMGLPNLPTDLADRARSWVVEAGERARRDLALPTARRHYSMALELLGPDLDSRAADAVGLLVERASLAVELWDTEAALADIELAQRMAAAVGDEARSARALVVRGRIEQRSGRNEVAAEVLTEAAEAYLRLGDHAGRAQALRERAIVEIVSGVVERAEVSALSALEAFETVGDRAGQGWARQSLAWIAFVQARTSEAAEHGRAAEEHFTAVDDQRGLAWARGVMAWIRFQQGHIDEALEVGERTLSLAHSIGDPWAIGMTELLVASVNLWTGNTDRAVDMASKALERFDTINDSYGRGQASAVLGRAMVMSGQVQEGLDLLHRAGYPAGAPAAAPGPGGGQVARLSLIAAGVQLGQPELGIEALEEMRAMAEQGSQEAAAALGMAALQTGDVVLAETYLLHGEEPAEGANLASVQTLLAAISGHGDVAALAARAEAINGSTYLDRTLTALARAVQAMHDAEASADPDVAVSRRGRAVEEMKAMVEATEATGDQVASAIASLLTARLMAVVGDVEAERFGVEAEQAIERLGISGAGWVRLLNTALDFAANR